MASQTNGDSLTAGNTNDAQSATELVANPAGGVLNDGNSFIFQVRAGLFLANVDGIRGIGSGGQRGFLGCWDPQYGESAGVYGDSGSQGVMGLTTAPGGTGVFGGGTTAAGGGQVGVRGETNTNVGVQGTSFGTGTGVQGVCNGGGIAVQGASMGAGTGVDASSTTGIGVNARSNTGYGVVGTSNATGSGVLGRSDRGVGVNGTSNTGDGVHGSSNTGDGVHGSSTTGVGVVAEANNSNLEALFAHNSGGGLAAFFIGGVMVQGNFTVFDGSKSAAVPHPDGSHRLLYCLESPESWFEDFGEGHLVAGKGEVRLDPDYAALVEIDGYQVFVTSYGDTKGLFVAERSATGFRVCEQQNGTSDSSFAYRVVAKRKDIVADRLATVTPPRKVPSMATGGSNGSPTNALSDSA